MPKFIWIAAFRHLPPSLFKSLNICGCSLSGQFSVPLRTTAEKCSSTYFINGSISGFPAKNLNFNVHFRGFAKLKFVSKLMFMLSWNMLVSLKSKYEIGFRLPICHCTSTALLWGSIQQFFHSWYLSFDSFLCIAL